MFSSYQAEAGVANTLANNGPCVNGSWHISNTNGVCIKCDIHTCAAFSWCKH